MGVKRVFLFSALFSVIAFPQEQKGNVEVQKIQELGIEIEKVAPEEAYGGEELLIQNIETKTGGEVIKGRLPEREVVPGTGEEEGKEMSTGSSAVKPPKMKPPEVRVSAPDVKLREMEVLYELRRRQRLKSVAPYLRNPQFLQALKELMKPQDIGTSEATDWLKTAKEEEEKKEEGVKVEKSELGYTPGMPGTPVSPKPVSEEEKGEKVAKERRRKGKFLFGYCVVDRDITVGALEMKARFPCIFNDEKIDSGHVWGTLKPMPKAYSLVFKPERIETLSGVYSVIEGTALNGSRSSVNVATTVNTRVIEKILGKAGVDTAKSTKSMVEEAWKNEGTTIYTTGTVTIEKKDFNLNILPYYALWTAGLSIAEGLMDLFQKETQNMPVLFSIHRGARLYVEVYVDEEPIAR